MKQRIGTFLASFFVVVFIGLMGQEILSRIFETDGDYQRRTAREQEELREIQIENDAKAARYATRQYQAIQTFLPLVIIASATILGALALWVTKSRLERLVNLKDGDTESLVTVAFAQKYFLQAGNRKLLEAESKVLILRNSQQQARFQEAKSIFSIAKTFQGALKSSTKIDMPALPDAPQYVPSFAQLLQNKEIAPGRQLILGFSRGEPQRRRIEDLKSLAVAGWQGSGKTLSMGFLATSILLQYPDSRGYVIDPHRKHPESLGKLLEPLESTGRLHVVNDFDLSGLMQQLNAMLDARLEDRQPSEPLVFLMIDELSRLGKTEMFQDLIIPFVERCTEETRKANILFIGAGQKWQARYFNYRADIRQAMPSFLLHKSKPSQAELILEDMDKDTRKMVKQLSQPGEALLATSHDNDPSLVRMPLITPADVLHVSQLLQGNGPPVDVLQPSEDRRGLRQEVKQYLRDHDEQPSILAGKVGINKGLMSRFLNSGRASHETRNLLRSYLDRQKGDVINLEEERGKRV